MALNAPNMANSTCSASSDDMFGPAVQLGCRDSFDFTLLFEQAILSIVPSALLLLLTPIRIYQLAGCSVKTLPTKILATKAVNAPELKHHLTKDPDFNRGPLFL